MSIKMYLSNNVGRIIFKYPCKSKNTRYRKAKTIVKLLNKDRVVSTDSNKIKDHIDSLKCADG